MEFSKEELQTLEGILMVEISEIEKLVETTNEDTKELNEYLDRIKIILDKVIFSCFPYCC